MATDILMPKWGLTMKEGKVSRWLKTEGDVVHKGEAIFEVETDKITNTVEAPADGVLFQIVVPAGETVAVKTVVGVLAAAGETPEKKDGAAPPVAGTQPAAGAQSPAAATEGAAAGAFVPATPIARRLARERGIDLALVRGTGPNGRITEQDILTHTPEAGTPGAAAVNAAPQAIALAEKLGIDLGTITGSGEGGRIVKADVLRAASPAVGKAPAESRSGSDIIPMTGMRKVIADNMMASLHNAAQLSVFVECDATAMTDFREQVRAKYAGSSTVPRISYNDIIALAVSRVLKSFPMMNSWLTDEGIVTHEHVNLGIAVALENGLMVPNVKKADSKSLTELAVQIRDLADKARKGGISMDDLRGGTFTITNVSMLGVDGFTPILNPPETGILGVGRVVERPAAVAGQIVIRKMMTLSLTFDHRVVDGAPAMRFLRTLADCVENPAMILA